MEVRVLPYIRKLARHRRVLLLGGHAMIFHGLERATLDSDIWLDASIELSEWCDLLTQLVEGFPGSYFWDLAGRRRCDAAEILDVVEVYGVIRIDGMEEPLDIFRRPNNFTEPQFEAAWELAASILGEEVRVFTEIDLLVSKTDTERQKDFLDIAYLEIKIRDSFSPVLRTCTIEEARLFFARYADHETCRAALDNPNPDVRQLAVETLRELAQGQNPFAREMLIELGHNEP